MMSRKVSILTSIALFALPVSAQDSSGFVTNAAVFASGLAQADDAGAYAKDYAVGEVIDLTNEQIDVLENAAKSNSNWKYLDLNVGFDDSQLMIEGLSVYGLYENPNTFVFNQTSLVNYAGRTTLNFGLGLRRINDDDTNIIGGNVFYDYELGSEHRRLGAGLEYFTYDLQFRANTYRALTGELEYNDVYERAMSGQDVKITYRLPFIENADLSYLYSRWYVPGGTSETQNSLSISAQLAPSLTGSYSAARSEDGGITHNVSLRYSIALGGPKETTLPKLDSEISKSVRHMMYIPVQRENRIRKTSPSFSVTVTGY